MSSRLPVGLNEECEPSGHLSFLNWFIVSDATTGGGRRLQMLTCLVNPWLRVFYRYLQSLFTKMNSAIMFFIRKIIVELFNKKYSYVT